MRTVVHLLRHGEVHNPDRVLYGTGGGIVADSDPALEWAETEAKALAFERALGAVVQRSIEPRRNER